MEALALLPIIRGPFSHRAPGITRLVGSSSVGKTRALYEAVRDVLPEWWLIHPDPADLDALRALAAEPTPRTVVWVDEIQRYLDGDRGLTVGTVLALLRASLPVVIAGTLWPHLYASYTAIPNLNDRDQRRWEREVLELADVVTVPAHLSDDEQTRACRLAGSDARLKAAIAVKDYGMIQVLAAAPLLVRRWENAPDPYSQAVLTAAIDAVRMGVRGLLPSAFLQAAAEGYCDNRQRASAAEGWFDRALAYATGMLHGAAAALAPAATRVGTVDGYLVADYLLQHGQRVRATVTPPDALWRSASAHVTDAADLGRLADSAGYRRLLPAAELLYRAAADAGVAWARFRLAELLDDQDRLEEAESAWRETVAEAGPSHGAALQRLQICLQRQGRAAEAEQILRDAAEAGAPRAYRTLWHFMWAQGRLDEAVDMARSVVAAGGNERAFLAELLDRQGHGREAEAVMRQAVAAGEPALMELGYLLEHHGRLAEAAGSLRSRECAGEHGDGLIGMAGVVA